MAERRCGTCQWFKRFWPKSDDPEKQSGSCQYKLKGPIPFAYKKTRILSVEQYYGKDCPTWHPKTT